MNRDYLSGLEDLLRLEINAGKLDVTDKNDREKPSPYQGRQ